MHINVVCPNCLTSFQLSPTMRGQQMRCPRCRSVFTVPAPPAEPPTATESAPRSNQPFQFNQQRARISVPAPSATSCRSCRQRRRDPWTKKRRVQRALMSPIWCRSFMPSPRRAKQERHRHAADLASNRPRIPSQIKSDSRPRRSRLCKKRRKSPERRQSPRRRMERRRSRSRMDLRRRWLETGTSRRRFAAAPTRRRSRNYTSSQMILIRPLPRPAARMAHGRHRPADGLGDWRPWRSLLLRRARYRRKTFQPGDDTL